MGSNLKQKTTLLRLNLLYLQVLSFATCDDVMLFIEHDFSVLPIGVVIG